MTPEPEHPSAEIIIGAFDRRGRAPARPAASSAGKAEVIRFAPYLLARRGRVVAPPAHPA